MSQHITLNINATQRAHLTSLLRSGNAPARTQTKARLLLLTDRSEGQQQTDEHIAQTLGISRATIIRVRRRFAQEGADDALYDKARPGKTPKITGEVEASLITLACSDPPEGRARRTLRHLSVRVVHSSATRHPNWLRCNQSFARSGYALMC